MKRKEILANKASRLIEDFIESFGYTAEQDVEFSADTKCNVICYTLYDPDTLVCNIAFKKYINEKFHITVPLYLLSILHEIGHIETAHLLTQREVNDESILKEIINNAFEEEKNENNRYIYFKAYWNLKIEYLANEWAINFIKTYTEECAEFWGKLKPIIKEYEGLC